MVSYQSNTKVRRYFLNPRWLFLSQLQPWHDDRIRVGNGPNWYRIRDGSAPHWYRFRDGSLPHWHRIHVGSHYIDTESAKVVHHIDSKFATAVYHIDIESGKAQLYRDPLCCVHRFLPQACTPPPPKYNCQYGLIHKVHHTVHYSVQFIPSRCSLHSNELLYLFTPDRQHMYIV